MESKNKEKNNKIRSSVAAKIDSDGVLVNNSTGESINPMEVLKDSDVYIVDAAHNKIEEQLATGIAIPTYRKRSWDYLNGIKDFDELDENDIYKYIEVSDKLYRFEPIIGTALDLFVDFAITDIELDTENEELKNIFNYLHTNINSPVYSNTFTFAYPSGLVPLMHEIGLEWFISGNVFPFSDWERTVVNGKEYKLPVRIVNLNPRSIKIARNDSILGAETISYNPGVIYKSKKKGTTTNNINNSSSGGVDTLSNILNQNKETPLDNKYVYHIKRRASSFKLWGIPFLTKVFSSIKTKRKLRYLDDSTIDGLVNYLVIFKVGSPDKDSPYHKVTPSRVAAFKALIENPQSSNMLVWPHDIDVLTVGPEGKVLDFADKYKTVDSDIIKSLGVPVSLLDGSGGNVNLAWVSVLALVERLETLRSNIENYVYYIIKQIAKANEIKYDQLSIKWKPTNLRDEKTIKTLLLAFYDRGLLPKGTTLFQGGYNPENILEEKKKEFEDGIDKYFERPDIPFSPSPSNTTNIKRFGSDGRPVDTVNTKASIGLDNDIDGSVSMPYTKLKKELERKRAMMQSKADIVADSFLENINNILGDVLSKMIGTDGLKRDKVKAAFRDIQHYQNIFIGTEIAFNSKKQITSATLSSFSKWRQNYINDIKDYFINVSLSEFKYSRKTTKGYKYAAKGFIGEMIDKFSTFYLNCLDIIPILEKVDAGNPINVTINDKEYENISVDEFFKKLPFNNLEQISFNA